MLPFFFRAESWRCSTLTHGPAVRAKYRAGQARSGHGPSTAPQRCFVVPQVHPGPREAPRPPSKLPRGASGAQPLTAFATPAQAALSPRRGPCGEARPDRGFGRAVPLPFIASPTLRAAAGPCRQAPLPGSGPGRTNFRARGAYGAGTERGREGGESSARPQPSAVLTRPRPSARGVGRAGAGQRRRPSARHGTHHAFLAEEAEEALVLLRGEQQRADVGDPPRLRGLLRGAAHGRAGTALPCDRWSPRPPTPPPPPRRPHSQQPHRGASLSGSGKEGGGGVGGPGERPAEGTPGRRQPRRRSRWRPPLQAALNFQLRPGSGGRTIQHGSGGGRDHSARQPEGRP